MDRSLVLMTPLRPRDSFARARRDKAMRAGMLPALQWGTVGNTAAGGSRGDPPFAECAGDWPMVGRSAELVCMHEGVAAADPTTHRLPGRPFDIRATKTRDTRRSAHR